MKESKPVTATAGFADLLEIFVVFVTGFWAALLVLTTILFVAKQPLRGMNVVLSSVLAAVFTVVYAGKYFTGYTVKLTAAAILFVITAAAAVAVSGRIYDLSYDGQAYHQEAVIQLAYGWNPVYMTLTNEATANLEIWLNHYPKGVWILAAGIYKLTGNIEAGKVAALYSGFMAFVFCLWVLAGRSEIPWVYKILGSMVLAFNPVWIYQSLSYYADGILVSLLLSLGAVCLKIYYERDRRLIYPFVFVFVVLVNIKLTSMVFAGLLVSGFVIYFWLIDQPKLALKLTQYMMLGLVIGGVFVGYNPYVTNFAKKGHPLYPAMGKGAYNYLPLNTPQNYWKIPAPLRFFGSIFSFSSQARGEGQSAQIKIPFTVSESELPVFRETNAKIGGFGPLYGGIFLIAAAAYAAYLVWGRFLADANGGMMLALVILLGTAVIFPTSSVARYVPYAWWLPVLIGLFLVAGKRFWGYVVCNVILLASIFDQVLVAGSYYPYNLKQSAKLEYQLRTLEITRDVPIGVVVGQFGSTKIKLDNHKISYFEVYRSNLCKSRRRFLTGNISEICEL